MSLFKTAPSRKPSDRAGPNETYRRTDSLRLKRLAEEEAKKAAGVWGDMSAGFIARDGQAFVYLWKGISLGDLYKLAGKRPKEIGKPDHEALCAWLKTGRYEGFKHTVSAWNITVAEAERVKLELISGLTAKGMRIVNPAG